MGKTIAELKSTLTEAEVREWMAFYQDYPFDDRHRFHRPAGLISVSLSGGDIEKKLNWLQPPLQEEQISKADESILKAFGIRK